MPAHAPAYLPRPVPAGFYIHPLDDDLPTPHLSFGASPGPHDVPRMAEIASRSRRPNRALNKERLAEARRVLGLGDLEIRSPRCGHKGFESLPRHRKDPPVVSSYAGVLGVVIHMG